MEKSFATPAMTARLLIHHKGLISTRCLASTGQHLQTNSERRIDNAPVRLTLMQVVHLVSFRRSKRHGRCLVTKSVGGATTALAPPIGWGPSHEACLTFLMSLSLLLCDASRQRASRLG